MIRSDKACSGVGYTIEPESGFENVILLSGDMVSVTPDWDPLLKQVAGIITKKGGRTNYLAIVARELGASPIVGCGNTTTEITDDEIITLSCAQGKTGYIYKKELSFEEKEIDFSNIKIPKTEAKMILADPENAFQLSFYPNNGVSLLRMEFIITHLVKVPPMALVRFDKIKDISVRNHIVEIIQNHKNKEDYFIDQLS